MAGIQHKTIRKTEQDTFPSNVVFDPAELIWAQITNSGSNQVEVLWGTSTSGDRIKLNAGETKFYNCQATSTDTTITVYFFGPSTIDIDYVEGTSSGGGGGSSDVYKLGEYHQPTLVTGASFNFGSPFPIPITKVEFEFAGASGTNQKLATYRVNEQPYQYTQDVIALLNSLQSFVILENKLKTSLGNTLQLIARSNTRPASTITAIRVTHASGTRVFQGWQAVNVDTSNFTNLDYIERNTREVSQSVKSLANGNDIQLLTITNPTGQTFTNFRELTWVVKDNASSIDVSIFRLNDGTTTVINYPISGSLVDIAGDSLTVSDKSDIQVTFNGTGEVYLKLVLPND